MTQDERHKRRWRNLLLDARYQITFALPMVLIVAALFAGLGHVAMRKAASVTKIGVAQIEQTGAPYLTDARATQETLLHRERLIRFGIVGSGVLLCLALALYGVVLSHRVAGPLYRLEVELGKLREGKLTPVLPLRKTDQLAELYDSFRDAVEAVRQREERDIVVMRQFVAVVEREAVGIDVASVQKLRERLAVKEAGLG
ncbi:MAG: hypothetical protein AAB426_12280 [Myxococcota bacterium]